MKRKSILCKLGFHKWGRARFFSQVSSNVRDYRKRCKRCGLTKSWVKPK